MLTRSSLLLLTFSFSVACKSADAPPMELAAAAPLEAAGETAGPPLVAAEAPAISCGNIPECPDDARRTPYQCVAYRYAGQVLWEGQRLYGWGPNLCEAKRALAVATCGEGKNIAQVEDLSCAPDPSMGSCPVPPPNCPDTEKPRRCAAKSYQGQELPWDQRPTAWGKNECQTKYLVLVRACEQGFDPQALSEIRCEADAQPGLCPPAPPTCTLTEADPTECLVSSVGDKPLKKPWKTVGTSACEAQYRLQDLLCRYMDSAKPLTSDSLNGMECRSLLGQTARSSP